MPRKPKTQQKATPDEVNGRDLFQTPNYAVDLLAPFIKDNPLVWECAAGLEKISNRLKSAHDIDVISTDLSYTGKKKVNFLTDWVGFYFDVIITNTPFSLKSQFYKRCLEYKVPFALLIPADYSGWIIKAVQEDGAEKIIPTRRIDYITPNILTRIYHGETWKWIVDCSDELDSWNNSEESMKLFIEHYPLSWKTALEDNSNLLFKSIYDAPSKLLRKYSSSYYHSMWLTWGFELGRTETFVELTNEDKNNI